MTASLVSLFRPREGWTNEERAQFARIERMLEDAGFGVDVEHGMSDEGEPWCVFCSRASGDVIIHVACIDNRFMFDSTTLPRPIEGANFQRCAERFFEDVSLPMPLTERRNRVLLHPSAMLASLFITILLYAQATTEQQLFDIDPVDVDNEDGDAVVPASPLALRIKSIAQQVQEFVNGAEKDTQAQAHQAYVNPGMATIPAGMALAVIAIAQDLAHAEESGVITDTEEPTLAALLRAAVMVDTQPVVAPEDEAEAVAEGDGGEGPFADPAEEQFAAGEAPGQSEEFAAAVSAALAGLGAFAVEVADSAEAAQSLLVSASEEMLSLGDVARLAVLGDADLGAEEAGSVFALDTTADLSAMFASMLEVTGLEQTAAVAFELAGRVWEIDVIELAADTIQEIELAVFSEDRFDLAGLDSAGTSVVLATPQTSIELDQPDLGTTVGRPAATGGFGPKLPSETVAQPDPIDTLPIETQVAEILANDRVVTEDEFDILLSAFTAQVGDIGIAKGRESLMFVDLSVTEHVLSRDIEAATVWLEDETRVTFVGTVWDFDGFLT